MADDGPGTPGVVNPVVFFDLVLGGAWNGFTHLHPTLEVVLCACHDGCQPIKSSSSSPCPCPCPCPSRTGSTSDSVR